MPLEAKPLFRPDVLRPHLAAFQLPPRVAACRQKLADWSKLLNSPEADKKKEKELLPDFLTDFFYNLLGYTGPASGQTVYTMSREKHVVVDGKFADAALGKFGQGKDEFTVAVEGKGPKDPLDLPHAGRKLSAVQQGYGYAINLPCDWIIVTSMKQTRLYHKGATQQRYEAFTTVDLAHDEALLKRFVFLLGVERIIPASGRCHWYDLLEASEKVGRELTKKFYIHYADIRQEAFEHLCRENPQVARPDILRCTQKLLDRILFCAFCEDRGLLPAETIRKAYEHSDPYHPRPVWENFQGLFRAVNDGNDKLQIPAYDGGLFKKDVELDTLRVPDEVCAYFKVLGDYDYRPPAQVAADQEPGEGQLIDVDILGHIFEQSITDLEQLQNELEGKAEPAGLDKHRSRRKKEGAFYTPAFITRYIVEQALGSVLKDRFENLRKTQAAEAKGAAKKALADPGVYDHEQLKKPEKEALIRFWEAWQDELKTIRLLDPACGSGAFLIEAFDQLHEAYHAATARLEELRGFRTLLDLDRTILENNLYGVDLNEEAIEICRLSLWIKTAARGKLLTNLDNRIRMGNSVVSDPAYAGDKAFNWGKEFSEVFQTGGFDVVVGNPPYIRQELLSSIKPYLQTAYQTYHGMADLYVYFYELGIRNLKPGCPLSFVVTNKWMKAGYGEPLRKFFQEQTWIESVVDFGHAKQIFEDADVFPSIIVVRKPADGPKPMTVRVCSIPREQLQIEDLSAQIKAAGSESLHENFREAPWNLETPAATQLLQKLRRIGLPLSKAVGVSTLRGVTTGLNEAFLLRPT